MLDNGRELDTSEPLISKRTYDVEVAIRTRREGITKESSQVPILDVGPKRDRKIWVVLCPIVDDDDSEVGVTVNQRFDSLVLPLTGDSSSNASFRVSARLRSGASVATFSLSFALYSRLDLIDNIVLQMTVANSAAVVVPQPATRFVQRRPDGTTIGFFGQRQSRRVTISVDQTTPGAFQFAVVAGTHGVPSVYATRTLSADMLNGFVSEFRTILVDAVFGPSLKAGKMADSERDKILGQMNQLGRRMFNVLFDIEQGGGDMAALGEMLRGGLTDGDIIQISLLRGATDFVFPWQILTVNDNFRDDKAADFYNLWGSRYSIEVKRCAEGGDLRPPVEATRLLPSFYYGRFGFKNEPAHFAKILATAEKALVHHLQPVIESRDELVPALLKSAKLFYFYAHGYSAAPATPAGMKLREHVVAKAQQIDEQIRLAQLAGLDASDDSLWAMSYRQFLDTTATDPDSHLRFARGKVTLAELTSYRDPESNKLIRLSNAPVVFLNTCQSAQVWNALDGSFVGFFLKRGASSVIGTESTIPISFAEPFANEVLNTIFNGPSVGEAVRQARLALMASHNNPLGLSYTVYGAADAKA
ncbi:CHAT domain-containing protein [Mesorhizobium silamurunense]|uniref:CHAT domain-containing protein n=1 Tax=Mesorhizobium silamurunense TaxID=499528 RepID=UPI00177FC75D|nr:CHAT domain-containing protein [Mesorhizobium silamurunense]